MKIRNMEFGSCWLSSGEMSFFGSGYWYHNVYQLLIPGFSEINNLTFVSKTTTLKPECVSLELDRNFQPKEWVPRCIKVYPLKGVVISAVNSSGPGATSLLGTGNWQITEKPFWLSFSAVGSDPNTRLEEMKKFCYLLSRHMPFRSPFGLQINMYSLNTYYDSNQLLKEIPYHLKETAALKIPLDIKLSAYVKTEVVKEIEASQLCDVITIGQDIPYGYPGINWSKISGKKSPVARYGGGELSGKPVFNLMSEKIKSLRQDGITMPIKGAGGIFSVKDVIQMSTVGANAIEIDRVLALRPWRVKKIIQKAKEIFK